MLISSITSLSIISLPSSLTSFFEKVKCYYACSFESAESGASSNIDEPGGLIPLVAWSLLYWVFDEGWSFRSLEQLTPPMSKMRTTAYFVGESISTLTTVFSLLSTLGNGEQSEIV